MKINYFIYCFLIFIFLNSCGYQRIYQSTEINYNVTKIEFKSDQKINKSIKRIIENLNKNVGGKQIKVVVNSQRNKTIITKDKKGDPNLFSLSINVEMYLYEEEILLNKKTFEKENKYSNDDNKFNLNIYEQNLEKNLNEKIIRNFQVLKSNKIMIVKVKEFSKNNTNNSNIFLFYGLNEGLKNELLNNSFLANFKGSIYRYEEREITEKLDNFYDLIFTKSFFDNEKIIILSRVSENLKIIQKY